ncbi:hypothetical protein COJ96_05960 [Bacillus sp. AFS073361]|uniref:hypothetical protein n=1 Tax=Bacillus sp. AFS073361 TaxID=2033511 RepID=UPI000BF665DB|nr:hypothetical protein [Bacillus sp. AFS073361]PFP30255.1 hypothetical protein COJ96_05960 [Bacillus sp. AFS073361]
MAIMPMKQTVTRIRKSGSDWDGTEAEERTQLKCAITEGAKLVRSMSGTSGVQGVTSSEDVSTAQIYFDKLADVQITDEFEYTNELGITRKYSPLTIDIKRLNGKPILTVVSV